MEPEDHVDTELAEIPRVLNEDKRGVSAMLRRSYSAGPPFS
ncbi:hypothetical protein [Mycobacterium lepromatosis]|nr:hypothetical protein [Mycobacterium lepromatosis]